MKAGLISIALLLLATTAFYFLKKEIPMEKNQIIPREKLFADADHLNAVSYTHLTLPTNREV